jgi:beta-N-acetylhexosaminidase
MTGVRGPGSAKRGSRWLVCGIAGAALDGEERSLLEELQPAGVVLFARNVADRGQLASLVCELRGLASRPYLAIDLEGGRVNRLEALIGPLPSAADAARAGASAVRALADAAGAACAHFGIGVDLAPVVDVARAEGFLASEARCLGSSPGQVRAMAAAFLAGLEAFGVAGCLKHYPGLGGGRVDSHRELPVLDESVRGDSEVFHELATSGRAVMVAHAVAAALGEVASPASLSRTVVGRLRARAAPILADDLEMGALSAHGTIAERAAAALAAGCDQVLVCNALDARRAVAVHVDDAAARDPSLAATLRESAARSAGFGQSKLGDVAWERVLELAARSRALAGMAQ